MVNKNICPKCGNQKKPWFNYCWECSQKEKQKPKCEVCGAEVQEGHNLCKIHWLERQQEEKKIKQIKFVENKKEEEFREKYKGKYYFNQIPFKSKSEVIIYLFLVQNKLHPLYEEEMNFDGHCYHPDFVINDGNETIIIEHFGRNEEKYANVMKEKISGYEKLCSEQDNFSFVCTTEEDLSNLKDKLGKKLNKTSLKRPLWN
ncbi:zinc ribbon domain-containing protein [Patescibacteria group bacterium]|nr:zinc ribbon domain-containing protein [Patescibacteria group bacterium]